MDLKKLCFDLASAVGTSGDEREAALFAKAELEKYMDTEIDTLGNVVGTFGGGKVHIILDAHIDQIGLVVRGIDEKGFLLVDRVGGPDERILIGSEVTVHGKEKLFGVVCSTPPHLLTADDKKAGVDIKKMAVDIGLSKSEAEKLIEIGDRITLRGCQYELLNGNIVSGAFDDRCSVAVILRALEMVEGKIDNLSLTVLFSVQEETGGSGAKTGAFSSMPDYAIAVDVGFGDDPYTDKSATIALGNGPSIGISPTLDKEFTDELKNICKDKGIPYQHDVMGGRTGTNADSINNTGKGVKTALLSVPLRYMHTGIEVINTDDIENTARLIAEYLLKKEAECCD
ncbi:MAG: M20/M25/M40 family metallo-hydrolase [Clostridia bacterium]|nr:M20/M25/M40 family metallo-hydrolase [Clostridia bacterium]